MERSTKNSKIINASCETLFHAFTNADALATWMAPGDMTAKVHDFDLCEGGGYTMSLYYPATDAGAQGKTGAKEDRYTASFITLVPPHNIVEVVVFDTEDSAFKGEMIMEVTLEEVTGGTKVTMEFKNIPPGIALADNEKGTLSSLQKLAAYVEG